MSPKFKEINGFVFKIYSNEKKECIFMSLRPKMKLSIG